MSWKRLKDKKLQKYLKIRSRIIQLVREFFVNEDFLEVETPILVSASGQEPHLNPLSLRVWDDEGRKTKGYLITSPEYALKKFLAAGFSKIFEITKCFRAGEHWRGLHNPEFTMLEWYRAHADYTAIMDDVERMVRYIHSKLYRNTKYLISNIRYQGCSIDLSPPWQRISMQEAWEQYAGVPKRAKLYDHNFLRGLGRERGYTVSKSDTYDDLFFKIFLTEIEPKLGYPKPTILYEYPASMAALARLKRRDKRFAERFEVYIAGMELANAFSELKDAKEQRKRFLKERALRWKLKKEFIPMDEDFLDAVGHMPPSAGIALGLDRLVMLLTNAAAIDDVLAFPAEEIFG